MKTGFQKVFSFRILNANFFDCIRCVLNARVNEMWKARTREMIAKSKHRSQNKSDQRGPIIWLECFIISSVKYRLNVIENDISKESKNWKENGSFLRVHCSMRFCIRAPTVLCIKNYVKCGVQTRKVLKVV